MTEPIDDISQDELVELPGTVRKPAAAGEDRASASNMPSRKSRNRRSREPAQKPGEQPSTRQAPARSTLTAERKTHAWVLLVAALLTFGAYLNALEGDFVYDDDVQIVKNDKIKHGELFWRAITTDVWAFKGTSGEARSNYWRPVFVTWMSLNYQLFGLNPTGWHLTSVSAHLVVTLLVYFVLVAAGMGSAVRAFVTWVFASHPVHVQSVTWISGSPDLLMSAFLLGSYLLYFLLETARGPTN